MTKKKIGFKTLGCRLNQYETDALATAFASHGYEIAKEGEEADAYIVNTCTITNSGDKKSRRELNRIVRDHPGAVVVATGCMVTHYYDRLKKESTFTYVVENSRKSAVFQLLDSHFSGEITDVEALSGDVFDFPAPKHGLRTRSFIKIQDGCDNFCSYCIVPFVRGRAVSRKTEDILNNIREVVENGFKEVVLTGVNIGQYHSGGTGFEDLVERILELPGDFRVRIGSVEPEGYGKRLITLFHHPKLMPHLHICLQSGSDKILKAMNRNYDLSRFESLVNAIRQEHPAFNFTTDIITGFPGETEEDFQQTVEAVDRMRFSHIHTFPFSVREGTRAAKMEGKINSAVMKERSEIIRRLSEKHKRTYRSSFNGKEVTVLIEKIEDGKASGYSEHYVPVTFPALSGAKTNTFANVKITGIAGGEDPVLTGEMV